jgi:AcrR family transcriptional regulator
VGVADGIVGQSSTRSTGLATPRRRKVDHGRLDDLLASVAGAFFEQGFTSISMDGLAQMLRCSKATLYALAPSKEQLVLRITKRFFADAADSIERSISGESDARVRIVRYLHGVGDAMASMSPAFYTDMVAFPPTARIYAQNSEAAARRVRQIIDDGVAAGQLREVHGTFASQLAALGIQGIQSGELLRNTDLLPGAAFAQLGDLLLNGLNQR